MILFRSDEESSWKWANVAAPASILEKISWAARDEFQLTPLTPFSNYTAIDYISPRPTVQPQ